MVVSATALHPTTSDAEIDRYHEDGAALLRGVFADWVDTLAAGVARNMAEPGPYASENTQAGEGGRFFDDYCNWQRIPEYRSFVLHSAAAGLAARLMRSQSAQFFHEHVLVKEAGTPKRTPWHQDLPYYCVDGQQTISMWVALDPVALDTCPQFVAGSHRWARPVRPLHWRDNSDFYNGADGFMELPDIDAAPEDFRLLAWKLAPGDAVVFNFLTVHGAPGNTGRTRRRGFSARWVGDDVRFVERPGRTSPPFPGIHQCSGERLREDWFPVVWPPTSG